MNNPICIDCSFCDVVEKKHQNPVYLCGFPGTASLVTGAPPQCIEQRQQDGSCGIAGANFVGKEVYSCCHCTVITKTHQNPANYCGRPAAASLVTGEPPLCVEQLPLSNLRGVTCVHFFRKRADGIG